MTELFDNRRKPYKRNFEDIEVGDCFEYDGEIFMAVEELPNVNAFNLTKKKNEYFSYDAQVIPVDVSVIVR